MVYFWRGDTFGVSSVTIGKLDAFDRPWRTDAAMTGVPGGSELQTDHSSAADEPEIRVAGASGSSGGPSQAERARRPDARRIVVGVVVLLLVIVGVVVGVTQHSKSSGAPTSSGVEYDADTVSPGGIDPCSLLTASTLGSITGTTYAAGTEGAATDGSPTCAFSSTSDGTYVNVEISKESFGSLAQWSGTIGFMLNYQGQPAGGPWIAGSSATLSNGSEIDFLAGRLNIAVLSNGLGEQAIYQAATAAAAHFSNATTSPGS